MNSDDTLQEHLQISDYLIQKIVCNELRPNEKVPSLNQLAAQFKVYRSVVERSLKRLENQGWVTPVHGKGYYVNEKPFVVKSVLSKHSRYSDTMTRIGEKPNSHLLDWRLDQPTEYEQEVLELESDEKVYRLDILRFAGSFPQLLSTSTLPEKMTPRLDRFLPAFHSLYALLEEHYQIKPEKKYYIFEARMPSKDESELLEIPEEIPVVRLESLNLHPNGSPVELSIARIRADRSKCVIDFQKLQDD